MSKKIFDFGAELGKLGEALLTSTLTSPLAPFSSLMAPPKFGDPFGSGNGYGNPSNYGGASWTTTEYELNVEQPKRRAITLIEALEDIAFATRVEARAAEIPRPVIIVGDVVIGEIYNASIAHRTSMIDVTSYVGPDMYVPGLQAYDMSFEIFDDASPLIQALYDGTEVKVALASADSQFAIRGRVVSASNEAPVDGVQTTRVEIRSTNAPEQVSASEIAGINGLKKKPIIPRVAPKSEQPQPRRAIALDGIEKQEEE